MTPEGSIKKSILSFLELNGIFCWNNPTGAVQIKPGRFMRFGKVGSADIVGILPGGRFLAVEVKTDKGRLSDEQAEFIADIRRLGGLAVIARSTLDVEKVLADEGYIKATLFDFGEHLAVRRG
jgi:hypothetical protein